MDERLAIKLFVVIAQAVAYTTDKVARKQAELWIMGVRDKDVLYPSTLRWMPRCLEMAQEAHTKYIT